MGHLNATFKGCAVSLIGAHEPALCSNELMEGYLMTSYNWDAPPPSWQKRSILAILVAVFLGALFLAFGGMPG